MCEEVSICLYLRLPNRFIALEEPVAARVFPEPPVGEVEEVVEEPPELPAQRRAVPPAPVRRPQPTVLLLAAQRAVAREARRVVMGRAIILRPRVQIETPALPRLREPTRTEATQQETLQQTRPVAGRQVPTTAQLQRERVVVAPPRRNRVLATEQPGPTQPRPMKMGPPVGKPPHGLEMGRWKQQRSVPTDYQPESFPGPTGPPSGLARAKPVQRPR